MSHSHCTLVPQRLLDRHPKCGLYPSRIVCEARRCSWSIQFFTSALYPKCPRIVVLRGTGYLIVSFADTLGARGQIIVGAHCLVVRRSVAPLPATASVCLGISALTELTQFYNVHQLNVVGQLLGPIKQSRGRDFRPRRIWNRHRGSLSLSINERRITPLLMRRLPPQ